MADTTIPNRSETERGFITYDEFDSEGTTITVRESSNAEGPFVWVFTKDPSASVDFAIELDPEQAADLAKNLVAKNGRKVTSRLEDSISVADMSEYDAIMLVLEAGPHTGSRSSNLIVAASDGERIADALSTFVVEAPER